MKLYRLNIHNLKCHGCANTITKQLNNLEGVSKVEVHNETDEVSFEAEQPEHEKAVRQKLAQLGYPVTDDPNSLTQKAKSLVSCAVGRMSKA